MISEEDVMAELKEIDDPETQVSIVDMGFIYDVEIEDDKVGVDMTLTSPGCPLHSKFTDDVEKRLSDLEGIKEVEVNMVFDPPWEPEMMSDKAKEKLGME